MRHADIAAQLEADIAAATAHLINEKLTRETKDRIHRVASGVVSSYGTEGRIPEGLTRHAVSVRTNPEDRSSVIIELSPALLAWLDTGSVAPVFPDTRIKSLLKEREAKQLELRAAAGNIDSIEAELTTAAVAALPSEKAVDPDAAVITFVWECSDPRNGVGFCVYDDHSDPSHDFCLFCGSPEERK